MQKFFQQGFEVSGRYRQARLRPVTELPLRPDQAQALAAWQEPGPKRKHTLCGGLAPARGARRA